MPNLPSVEDKLDVGIASTGADGEDGTSESDGAQPDFKDMKESKFIPRKDQLTAEQRRSSPDVAEAKLQADYPSLHQTPIAASPMGNPGSSEKPSRPATPAAAETSSAKSTGRPVKSRENGTDTDSQSVARSAEKEYDRASSPEVKLLNFGAKSESKTSEKKTEVWQHTPAKAEVRGDFSSPILVPGEGPPDQIVESFRSARKAIESSVDATEKSRRRERSDSLDEVLRDHPDMVDPLTGEVSGSIVPSKDVLQHHFRTNSAKELVGLGNVSSSLQTPEDKASSKHSTAIALTNTARALEGKLPMVISLFA